MNNSRGKRILIWMRVPCFTVSTYD